MLEPKVWAIVQRGIEYKTSMVYLPSVWAAIHSGSQSQPSLSPVPPPLSLSIREVDIQLTPRRTRQLPPPAPSESFLQMPGYKQPTQQGQFTQAGWQSQPLSPLPSPNLPLTRSTIFLSNLWRGYRIRSLKQQVGIGGIRVLVLILVCGCLGIGQQRICTPPISIQSSVRQQHRNFPKPALIKSLR